MEPEVRQPPVRFNEIDLLRFLAALSVVFYHYTYRGYMSGNYTPIAFPELGKVTRYGYLGVELFFIISGYVVLLSAQSKTVRQFFLSRVTRLYPAFWVACTLTFLVTQVWGTRLGETHMAAGLHTTFSQYVYNMTMLEDFFGVGPIDGVYWTLNIEITFYFLISLLIGYKLMRYIDLFLIFWLILVVIIKSSASRFGTLLFPEYASYFIAGMLFYLLPQSKSQGRTWLRYILLAIAYALSIKACITEAIGASANFHEETSWKVTSFIISGFYLVMWLITFRKINLQRFTWLRWLGTLTYPLYLVHGSIGFIIFHRVGSLFNKYSLLVVVLIGMLLVAHLIHVLIEKRISRPLGKFLNEGLTMLEKTV